MFPLCLIFIFSNVVLLSNFFGNDCFIPTFLAHVVLLSNPSGGVSLIPNFHDKKKHSIWFIRNTQKPSLVPFLIFIRIYTSTVH